MFAKAELRARRRVTGAGILLVVLAAAFLAVPATASNAVIVVPFEKQSVGEGHYLGTTGDGGEIEMFVYDSWSEGGVQHFTTTLLLSYPDRSLTAILDGRFNFSTGRVVLNGKVVDGWLKGARVHEESRLVGISPLQFVGTVQLMPGSAR